MNNQKKMGVSTGVLSLTLLMFFTAGSADMSAFDVFALKGEGVPVRSYGSGGGVCGGQTLL